MLRLDMPDFNADTVYKACTEGIDDAIQGALVLGCINHISDAEAEFNQRAQAKTTQLQTMGMGTLTAITRNDLKNLYDQQMVNTKLGRVYYDLLKLSAPFEMCPMCGHGLVSTLDHYLPKFRYPLLSVVPINLIPCCKDCNTGKLISYPVTPQDQTLHPYYDDIENFEWLALSINRTTPLSVTYYVNRPHGWSNLLYDRVCTHFTSFKLEKNYGVLAARALAGMKGQLTTAFHSLGQREGVKRILREMADSHEAFHLNYWQTVLYSCLANDEWFCNGGFNQIIERTTRR